MNHSGACGIAALNETSTMEADEIDDSFFDRNIDQLDVRETPR